MRRRIAAVLILAAWAVSFGVLLRRQLVADPAPAAGQPARVSPDGAYLAVRLGREQVGLAAVSVDTTSDGLRWTERLDLQLGGLTRARVLLTTSAELDPAARLERLTLAAAGDGPGWRLEGTAGPDDGIRLALSADGDSARPLRVAGPAVPLGALPLHLALNRRLAAGDSLRVAVLDPVRVRRRLVDAFVTAESTFVVVDSAAWDSAAGGWRAARLDTVPAWRVVVAEEPGLEIWTDAQGLPVSVRTREGYAWERTAFELATAGYRDRREREARDAGLAVAGLAVPAAPDRSRPVRFRVDTTGGAPELEGGRQRLRGDTLFVAGLARSDAGDPEAAARERLRALGSEPLIPVTDRRVQALARRLANGRRTPRARVDGLLAWMRGLGADREVGAPDAIGVLEQGRGDPAARSLLFTALARAAGIPARTAAGVARVRGRWYYHTWVEVWLDGWTPVDPTFGGPAGTVVRLATGLPGRALELQPRAARLFPLGTATR